ncbi:MAG: tetratricopeptide repeat protein [Candidatus Heimdallarchaeota archaeon]|nr:tetratricopeptide repeat protein [Candidatus Heimdallarchaeota archaeon]
MPFTSVETLLDKGEYKKAAELLLAYKTENKECESKKHLLFAQVHNALGEFKNSIYHSNLVVELAVKEEDVIQAQIYTYESAIYQGDYLNLLENVELLLESINNSDLEQTKRNQFLFHGIRLKIHLLTDTGKYLGLDTLVDRLESLAEGLDSHFYSLLCYHEKARVLDFKGQLLEAEKYYKMAISFAEGRTYYLYQTGSIHNLANIYYYRGEFSKAIELYDQEIEILKKLESPYYITVAQSDKAWCYFSIGETEQSLDIFDSCERFLKSREEVDYIFTSEILMRRIIILASIDRVEEAKVKFDELKKIKHIVEGALVDFNYNLAEASLLKTSKQVRKRAKAMNIFEKITQESIFNFEFTVYSYFSLAQLLVDDYHYSGEIEVLQEIEFLIQKLYEYAEEQKSSSLKSQANWLNAKIALIKDDFDKAKQLMVEAILQAEKTGFFNLARQISDELDDLEYQLEHDIIDERFWHFDLANTLLFNIKKETDEDSILFLIQGDSGLPLYSKFFTHDANLDENMIGSFLNAITTFGKQALRTHQNIKRIQYQEYVILIENSSDLQFIYVIKGKTYHASRRLARFIAEFKKKQMHLKIFVDSHYLTEEVEKELDIIIADSF